MIDDDPLLSALASLPSPALPVARGEQIRVHVRAMIEPEATPLLEKVRRVVGPVAIAACVVAYLGWTVGRITEGGPGHVVASEGNVFY